MFGVCLLCIYVLSKSNFPDTPVCFGFFTHGRGFFGHLCSFFKFFFVKPHRADKVRF